jgi:hypothetical protein
MPKHSMPMNMTSRLLAGLLALAFAFSFALAVAGNARAADDATFLTITGKIGKTNRGPSDPFLDGFTKYHDRHFDKAFAFTRAMLADLPQTTVTAQVIDWPKAIAATGPRLADVLAAAGVAKEAPVFLLTLDGYGVELSAADRAAHDWIVAIAADGRPLGIGGRGPVWVLYDSGGTSVGKDVEATWAWAVFLIEAR